MQQSSRKIDSFQKNVKQQQLFYNDQSQQQLQEFKDKFDMENQSVCCDSSLQDSSMPSQNGTQMILRFIILIVFGIDTLLSTSVGFYRKVLCHITAICRNLLCILEVKILEYPQTWRHEEDSINADWDENYQHCFYWAIATVMLIGSKGNNNIEAWFTILTILTCVGVFAYTISEIANIIDDINKDSINYKNELAIINKYMKSLGTSIEIQSKVRNYLEFLHQYSTENPKKETTPVLEKLPLQLRQELVKENNYNLLKQFPQFRQMFSANTLDQLCEIMQEQLYLNEEIVFQQDQTEEISIYLIHKGQVNLYNQQNDSDQIEGFQRQKEQNTLLKMCQQGDIFGTFGQIFKFTAKCVDSCTLYKILKSDFDMVMRDNEQDLEKIKMIKDRLFLNRGINRITSQSCMICGLLTHPEEKCPQVHFVPTSNDILRINYSQDVIRNENVPNQEVFQRSESNMKQILEMKQANRLKKINIQKQLNLIEKKILRKPRQTLRDKESQKYNTLLEFDELNAYALYFQTELQKETEHFLHNQVYSNRTYQNWLKYFKDNNKIDCYGNEQGGIWFIIWLDKYLEEQQVYCDDIEDDVNINGNEESLKQGNINSYNIITEHNDDDDHDNKNLFQTQIDLLRNQSTSQQFNQQGINTVEQQKNHYFKGSSISSSYYYNKEGTSEFQEQHPQYNMKESSKYNITTYNSTNNNNQNNNQNNIKISLVDKDKEDEDFQKVPDFTESILYNNNKEYQK
ncbi:Cyclic nucleotide-binding protein [Pseudocohnilembus persalinus]|uniref:Cyclic nucleotide-binding protein n=1 Tax=Pseudocohnilembus persalinus TaxID=266149 RepID=A0A0V0QFZ8_PSEPJ|nr:Cyclic nucleotide-binding protein [Pseudocohnilembus persalinus]|eukprot:KRX01124.1 Cyclic nucleotide-binding protein [Pseudocohnilembus persalinus]